MARVWFSMTSIGWNRCWSAAIWLAMCGSGAWNVAMSVAVPKPAWAGGGLLVAAAAPMTVAATATVISARTSSCCRHSRRNSRHAQRVTARRAGTPPFLVPAEGAGAAGLSRSAVLIATAPGW